MRYVTEKAKTQIPISPKNSLRAVGRSPFSSPGANTSPFTPGPETIGTKLHQLSPPSFCPEDQVHAAIGENRPGHFSHLHRVRRVLERLLHRAPAEGSQIPPVAGRGAVRLDRGQLGKVRLPRPDLPLELQDHRQGLLPRPGDALLLPT